jgi:MOSC domain-containing protein YiiM
MTTDISGLYIGEIAVLGPEGQRNGIFKRPVAAVEVSTDGVQGDHQADRRVHGGPEKAVHHYAADNYKLLATRFPGIADAAGMLPEPP